MILSDLLKDLAVKEVKGETNIDIQDIQFDSRQVKPGTLFVAQPGTVVDGHDYIDKAIEAGAAAIVCERTDTIHKDGATVIVVDNASHALGLIASAWNGYPSRHLTLVGVTGTNGKTTIATLLYKMVRAMGHKAGLLSTVVNYVNDEPVQATHTTPDALELNGLLKQMVDAGCRYAFMEVSSHAIAQQRIAGLDFDGNSSSITSRKTRLPLPTKTTKTVWS